MIIYIMQKLYILTMKQFYTILKLYKLKFKEFLESSKY